MLDLEEHEEDGETEDGEASIPIVQLVDFLGQYHVT